MASKSQPAQQRPPELQLAKWPLDEDIRSMTGKRLSSDVRTSPRVMVARYLELDFHPMHGVKVTTTVEARYSPAGSRTPICAEHPRKHDEAFDSVRDAISWARDMIEVDTRVAARVVEAMVAAAVVEMVKP